MSEEEMGWNAAEENYYVRMTSGAASSKSRIYNNHPVFREWSVARRGDLPISRCDSLTARLRTGRAHRGQLQRAVSNERWCSDGLEIACWNGEYIQIAFVLECHDR